jgi:hypothetical protein
LAENYGDAIPFGIAVGLCGVSFGGNLLRLKFGWGKAKSEEVVAKRVVRFGGLDELGDVYWMYILL